MDDGPWGQTHAEATDFVGRPSKCLLSFPSRVHGYLPHLRIQKIELKIKKKKLLLHGCKIVNHGELIWERYELAIP